MPDDPTPPEAELPLVFELPDYHGRKPTGMKSSITGSSNRLGRPHSEEETIVAVIELRLVGSGHEFPEKNGLTYVEKLKCRDLFEVPGEAGRRLLSAMRSSYRTADDQRAGRKPLENEGVDLEAAGVTDASGVVLTPSELAELRGDPVRAALSDAMTPVVVVFSDGARELWPDEFDPGEPRPKAGDRFEGDGEGDGPEVLNYVFVREILHGVTGERLEEWTDEQEDGRLLELEQRLEAEEGKPPPAPSDAEVREGFKADGEVVLTPDAGTVAAIVEDDEGFADVVQLPRTPELVQVVADGVGAAKNRIREIESRDDLVALKGIEEAGKNRKGVLGAIAERLAALPEPPVEVTDLGDGLEDLDPGDGAPLPGEDGDA